MKMQSFIVVGIGRFGNALAKELYREGHEVLVLDENMDAIQKIADDVTHAITGDATDPDVLKSIGVRNFDCVIVSIASDIQNSILVTLQLKEMGAPYVVAKARNEIHMKMLKKIGADKVVFPEHEMGERLAQLITMKNVIDYLELSDHYSIMEIKAPEKWVGKTIAELDIRAKYSITVIAIRNETDGSLVISIGPDYQIGEEDILVVLGNNDDIERLNRI